MGWPLLTDVVDGDDVDVGAEASHGLTSFRDRIDDVKKILLNTPSGGKYAWTESPTYGSRRFRTRSNVRISHGDLVFQLM